MIVVVWCGTLVGVSVFSLYGCMYFLTALVLVCIDVMVMSSAQAMICYMV